MLLAINVCSRWRRFVALFVSYKRVFSLEEVCSLCLLAINVCSRWRRFVVLFVSYKRVFLLEEVCSLVC